MHAAELFVFIRAEFRDDEVTCFAEEKTSIVVLHHESMAPAHRPAAGRRECFPEALAGFEVQATKLAIATRAVNISALDQRCGHHTVQAISVLLTDFLALPGQRGLIGIDTQCQ